MTDELLRELIAQSHLVTETNDKLDRIIELLSKLLAAKS
jgi:hypothetical protein